MSNLTKDFNYSIGQLNSTFDELNSLKDDLEFRNKNLEEQLDTLISENYKLTDEIIILKECIKDLRERL